MRERKEEAKNLARANLNAFALPARDVFTVAIGNLSDEERVQMGSYNAFQLMVWKQRDSPERKLANAQNLYAINITVGPFPREGSGG